MNDRKDGLHLIEAAFSQYGYPPDFLADYDQLECLSGRRGRETFLVRARADGALAVAKCYDRAVLDLDPAAPDPAEGLDHPGLPRFRGKYHSDRYLCVVRDYVEGTALSDHVRENAMTQEEIVAVCCKLCDVLSYLHSRPQPVIHRDIKPENVILTPAGGVCLIDFDIARTFKPEAESDTLFFGTKGYAPPEQYGFAQTDARTDIYSLGVLLRYLLTGSVRENKNIRLYRPLEKIIARCTAFAPEKRYPNAGAVKKALLAANPRSQLLRKGGLVLGIAALCAVVMLAGWKVYQAATYSPFHSDAIPAVLNDEERVADAVAYMKDKYGTDLFDSPDDLATVGLLRRTLIEVYGLDRDYVYAFQPDGLPQESEDYFMPWGWEDSQNARRDTVVYAAVKVHDPSIVADWSSLKDDTGEYPGSRVAVAFAEETGILTGANRPYDITAGELALIFANADRVFEAAEQ